jgi:hypothetical protein
VLIWPAAVNASVPRKVKFWSSASVSIRVDAGKVEHVALRAAVVRDDVRVGRADLGDPRPQDWFTNGTDTFLQFNTNAI